MTSWVAVACAVSRSRPSSPPVLSTSSARWTKASLGGRLPVSTADIWLSEKWISLASSCCVMSLYSRAIFSSLPRQSESGEHRSCGQ